MPKMSVSSVIILTMRRAIFNERCRGITLILFIARCLVVGVGERQGKIIFVQHMLSFVSQVDEANCVRAREIPGSLMKHP